MGVPFFRLDPHDGFGFPLVFLLKHRKGTLKKKTDPNTLTQPFAHFHEEKNVWSCLVAGRVRLDCSKPVKPHFGGATHFIIVNASRCPPRPSLV